ncbi:UDP:flavonoid glycosyltransferase YjiC, YdhE family [Dyadobacter sp. SG02]|uniref:glycosyltransferase n=1 Tax=Dyadobacter sp. SG02 TaxID=1855291 RepID=UPI0008CC8A49|nr:nucleotide disphospho-sugar-binding domain-containing protein [Dyadobacter sp. SG02]SEJ78928.1 UDP:flavonoid glycosyltransferase YjiC, YdhE family [Dyadobacter sp. SG02]
MLLILAVTFFYMKTVLFDVQKYSSHYTAAFGMAKRLSDSDIKVVFIGEEKFATQVTNEGFIFISYQLGVPKLTSEGLSLFRILGLHKFDEWKLMVERYMKVVKEINADIVLLDEDVNYRLIWYRCFGVRAITFSTKPFNGPDASVPPYTIAKGPKKSLPSTLLNSIFWAFEFSKNVYRFLALNLNSLGQCYFTFSHRLGREHNIDFLPQITFRSAFKWSFLSGPKLILAPSSFDFRGSYPKNVYHLALHGSSRSSSQTLTQRYRDLLDEVKSRRCVNPATKLIFCSLGTMTSLFEPRVKSFFLKLRKLAERRSDLIFILSLGGGTRCDFLYPLPTNLNVFHTLPQTHVLQHADMMINHGGMNSVLECISFRVPQLVLPLSKQWEQNGNAAKVSHFGIGLGADLNWISETELNNKIEWIFTHHDQCKSNLESLNKEIGKERSENNVTEILNRLISDESF